MKTSIASSWRSVLAVVVLLSGCQPDLSAPLGAARDLVGDPEADRPVESCQVVRNEGQDSFLQTYRYDSRGLVSRWDDGFGTLIPQYDARGILVRARYGISDALFVTIVYEYQGSKVVREIWYQGGTDIVDDVVVNTWNAKGQLIRRESLLFGVYATFQYDAIGNAYQVDVLATNGFLFLSNTYSFTAAVKSPDLTLRGLPYGLQFINHVFNPWRQTAAKAVVTDIEGNRITLFDQDPAKSILIAGRKQFALYQNFFDKLSGTYYAQSWTYQNCPGNNYPPDVPPPPPLGGVRSQVAGAADLLLRGSMRDVRQQVEELKRRYGK
jgi:hypothetical protein